MASGLTHILLTKKLQDELSNDILKSILAFGVDSFQVGAVAPDLPYASIIDNNFFFSNESHLADNFHYKQTNEIPLRALRKLKNLNGMIDERLHYQMFAFFLGYISHVIADGIIHPFVRDKVGDYKGHQSEHRSLEMQLDVLFLEEITKNTGFTSELNFSKIHDELMNFPGDGYAPEIIKVFSELIESTYNEQYSVDTILGWIKGLHRLFDLAEGDHPRFYRILEKNTFTYRNREDINRDKAIKLNKPVDRDVNFLRVGQVDFFNDCVPQYYRRFIDVATKAHDYVYHEGIELSDSDIPLINLDTGRLIANDNLEIIPVLWT